MKVIYNNIIPFKGYKAINLFGLVFVRKGAKFTEVDISTRKHYAWFKYIKLRSYKK